MELGKKILKRDQQKIKQSDLNLYLNIIAHEIRNPLVSVQGYASLLQDKFGRYLPEEGMEYLQRIVANLNRTEMLLADITRLARISINESGFVCTHARDLIEAALESHLFQLNNQNIELTIAPRLPTLYCDANCMILVFSNLIGNAIKYSRDARGGRIHIGYLGDEIFHKFFVQDNGVGFRRRDSHRVFRVFERLRNKKNVTGTGLGLSIVKQIIEGHGGEIWVESRKNRGATFYFTLPKNTP